MWNPRKTPDDLAQPEARLEILGDRTAEHPALGSPSEIGRGRHRRSIHAGWRRCDDPAPASPWTRWLDLAFGVVLAPGRREATQVSDFSGSAAMWLGDLDSEPLCDPPRSPLAATLTIACRKHEWTRPVDLCQAGVRAPVARRNFRRSVTGSAPRQHLFSPPRAANAARRLRLANLVPERGRDRRDRRATGRLRARRAAEHRKSGRVRPKTPRLPCRAGRRPARLPRSAAPCPPAWRELRPR